MFKNIDILNMDKKELENFFISIGEKPFRAKQVMLWIYKNLCFDFDKMTNLNKFLRRRLKSIAIINIPKIIEEKQSCDGTIKWLIQLDKEYIETVYIPEVNRVTLCISSQIGCILKCDFCETGKQGFSRNLKISEIVGQILIASVQIKKKKINNMRPITNIVFMGMGEPLLNLSNVIPSIKIILDRSGFSLSKHRVTVSTSGIPKAFEKLFKNVDVKLALSLHAPNDQVRDKIMPINKKYNIFKVIESIKKCIKISKVNQKYLTIEYVMIHNINDQINYAYELANLLKSIKCKINLIPLNNSSNRKYKESSFERIKKFCKILKKKGYFTFIRKNRGRDIEASCGQLSGKIINNLKNS